MPENTSEIEDITIGRADISALDAIMEIETEAFPDPWSRSAMIHELTDNEFGCYFVIRKNGKIVGYCGYWRILEEAHITNIAVASGYRGQGFGRRLLLYVLLYAAESGAESMTLEVRPSNAAAVALYESLGFRVEGIRRKYYTNNGEDALIMWHRGLEKLLTGGIE